MRNQKADGSGQTAVGSRKESGEGSGMNDELDQQFDEAWQRDNALMATATNQKDLAQYWWLKGRILGLNAGLRLAVSADDNPAASFRDDDK